LDSFQIVDRIRRQSSGASCDYCVHTADTDATKQFRRVGVGGVYWALLSSDRQRFCRSDTTPFTQAIMITVSGFSLFRPGNGSPSATYVVLGFIIVIRISNY